MLASYGVSNSTEAGSLLQMKPLWLYLCYLLAKWSQVS